MSSSLSGLITCKVRTDNIKRRSQVPPEELQYVAGLLYTMIFRIRSSEKHHAMKLALSLSWQVQQYDDL